LIHCLDLHFGDALHLRAGGIDDLLGPAQRPGGGSELLDHLLAVFLVVAGLPLRTCSAWPRLLSLIVTTRLQRQERSLLCCAHFARPPSRHGTSSTAGYFRAALTGSLTFSTVANSMFQSSPFTFSTLRI